MVKRVNKEFKTVTYTCSIEVVKCFEMHMHWFACDWYIAHENRQRIEIDNLFQDVKQRFSETGGKWN